MKWWDYMYTVRVGGGLGFRNTVGLIFFSGRRSVVWYMRAVVG